MKALKIDMLLLTVLLAVSLSLLGCSVKTTKIQESVNISEEQGNSSEAAKNGDTIEDISYSEDEDITENTDNEEEQSPEEAPDVAQTEPVKAVESTESTKVVQEPEKSDADNDKDEPTENPPVLEAEVENALKIQGNVANTLSISLDELKGMKEIIFEDDFYSLNSFGTTGHTRFKGVNLWSLLEQKAQISSKASRITVIATDGYKMEFTIDQVKKQDYIDETNQDKKFPMIIAWEEKGQEYDPEDGPPYKLVVGQREAGDVNKPQWVSNIDRIIVE